MRFKSVFAASAVFVALTAAAAEASQAADQTLGMAIMSAFVGSNGKLVEGAGVVSSARIVAGRYDVTFNRPLAGCVSTATQWGIAGSILSVYPHDDIVSVYTNRPTDGNPVDYDFQLIVFCSK